MNFISILFPADTRMSKCLNEVIAEAKAKFEEIFHEKPSIYSHAAGRVNLIGEHVDYNDGFVLPMAIPLYTVIVGKLSTDNRFEIYSTSVEKDNSVRFDSLEAFESNGRPKWASYVLGVFALYPGKVPPFKAIIHSTVPLGGGLSSSASLETSTFWFLDSLATEKSNLTMVEIALLCQKAEHIYANVPCGVMDQFSCALSKKDHALLLDCRSLTYEYLPITDPNLVVLVTNSNVKHELNNSEYADRRRVCHQSAELLGEKSLRDVSEKNLEENAQKLNLMAYKRAKHVVTEIQRTEDSAKALKQGDYLKFGQLMVSSHMSLKDDFEVSCPELDQLVDLAVGFQGVYGSRMTGGGFGGCTVTLVRKEFAQNLVEFLTKNYQGRPTFYFCTPVDGSGIGQF